MRRVARGGVGHQEKSCVSIHISFFRFCWPVGAAVSEAGAKPFPTGALAVFLVEFWLWPIFLQCEWGWVERSIIILRCCICHMGRVKKVFKVKIVKLENKKGI